MGHSSASMGSTSAMTPVASWLIRLPQVTSIIAVMVGLSVVVVAHAGRSSFYDEAWVIQYARSPSLTEALSWVMHDRQPAAAGYLAVMYSLARVADGHAWLYRMPAAAAAAAVIGMTGWLAGRWCRTATWGWAAALVVLACPLFQRYATEVKQYLPAAAISLGLIIAADRWVTDRSRGGIYAWVTLAVAGVVTGFSTWFAVSGTGMVMVVAWVVKAYREGDLRSPRPLHAPLDWNAAGQMWVTCALGLLVIAVAVVIHLTFNRFISGSGVLDDYWSDQFLRLSCRWPADVWQVGAGLFEQAWYRYSVPGQRMMAGAVIGWLMWCWRQPIAGWSVATVIAATLMANTLGLWPLGVRVNLPLVVLAHLCLLAGPMIALGWVTRGRWSKVADPGGEKRSEQTVESGGDRRIKDSEPKTPSRRWVTLQWAGVVVTGCLLIGVVHETCGADYETAAVGQLLDELARRAGSDDLVLMTTAAYVNQQLRADAVPGRVIEAPWPQLDQMVDLYWPLIQNHDQGTVWFAAGHHNDPMRLKWEELGRGLSEYGRFEKSWSGKNVALYHFEPTQREKIRSIGPAAPHDQPSP